MRILYFILLIGLSISLHSQSLTITDGSDTKTFNTEGYFDIMLKDDQCCNGLTGSITAITDDRITMQLDKFRYSSQGEIRLQNDLLKKEQDGQYSFSVDHLNNLTHYTSQKGKKWSKTYRPLAWYLF